MKYVFIHILMQIFMNLCLCYFYQISMKFSPKCRSKKLGMTYIILGSFCSFLNWKGADIGPQIRPRKTPKYKGFIKTIFEPKFVDINYFLNQQF